ncbi:synaptonemal complex central element protein 2 isoform X2 [Epinephelus fuscoguttatus]|uniref:synaptonemal complex central element protein 2 isoform X2 n=1 Tax=Epinephelus fuscoguttatus TaxID=293821 RepID=UPI0020D07902|nr:synaptonemal complex central element protein 2 isoform X2 [Epinephelus fuscoguttatus]
MDFFSSDLPSTSLKDSQMTEDLNHSPSRGKSSSNSMTDTGEQHTRSAQELVIKINDSRTSDQKVFNSFQEKLLKKVTEMCQQMQEHMYNVYEENSNVMQVYLQELSDVLERCSQLNSELFNASQALESLRGGLAMNHASEP